MRSRPLPLTLLACIVAGCLAEDPAFFLDEEAMDSESGDAGGAETGEDSMAPQAGGLPCEVEAVLQQHCQGCHRPAPAAGPFPLLTHGDLLSPALTDPAVTVAEMTLVRLEHPTSPMPPSPAARVSDAEVEVMRRWLEAGSPPGDCQPEADPFDVPATCTSEQFWVGDEKEPTMFPGRGCVGCHQQTNAQSDDPIPEAPTWLAGGTVYPSAHEPDDCFGASSVTVEVIDADGVVHRTTSNATGNFLIENADLRFPITARLVTEAGERRMTTPAAHGDCNACHTQDGQNGAPGRVLAP